MARSCIVYCVDTNEVSKISLKTKFGVLKLFLENLKHERENGFLPQEKAEEGE